MSESQNNSVDPSTWRFVAKRSCESVTAYMKEWDRETKEKVSQGEPLIVADVLTPHEILEAMDIPYVLRAFGVTVLKDWLYPTLFSEEDNEHSPDFLTAMGNEMFGQERLEQCLMECDKPENIFSHISASLDTYREGKEQEDDRSL